MDLDLRLTRFDGHPLRTESLLPRFQEAPIPRPQLRNPNLSHGALLIILDQSITFREDLGRGEKREDRAEI